MQSLEIGPLSIDLCHTVFQQCDLTKFKGLKLLVRYNYRGLDYIASSVQLPRLRNLVFGSTGSTEFLESEHGEVNFVVPFLGSRPPLEAVRLIAQINQDILDSTLQRHGPSLRRLWFHATFEERRDLFRRSASRSTMAICPFARRPGRFDTAFARR